MFGDSLGQKGLSIITGAYVTQYLVLIAAATHSKQTGLGK